MRPSSQSRVFVSYSHHGNGPKWMAALLQALHVFDQHHLLDVWQDGKIRISSCWNDDIQQAMASAQVAVVLLTPEALASEYILNTEFPCLKARQQAEKLAVFPVICEPCEWRSHDWLRATQAPNQSNPLSRLADQQQDRVFRLLATEIVREVSHVALSGLASPVGGTPPPARTYLEKFPLTRGPGLREEKLIGRDQELALLNLTLAQPQTAIVSLVAWGGVGKTMLVQHWLQGLEHRGWPGAQRVYAWSFYSQGTKEDRQASEDDLLAHALEWFGVQCEPTLSPWDKGRLLADAVARERTLLILDGIEPLQYPPGPMGGQLRAPGVQSLLKQLARKANSAKSENQNSKSETNCLCLVTTREPLTDLADFQRREGSPWGSVLRVDLGKLTDDAGAALLHHAGANRAGAAEIEPDDKELLAASREVDGHALTLNLLSRFLARAHGGDIRRRNVVRFQEADRQEQGGTTFKMLAAFENWFAKSGDFGARQLAVLRILGLFDRPADVGSIAALRRPPVIAELTDPLFTTKSDVGTGQALVHPLFEEDWMTAISFLADFGLLAVLSSEVNQKQMLDCHPLVREYFAMRLRTTMPESWRDAHRRLYKHLKRNTDYHPDTLEALQPLYQALVHGCLADMHEDACENVYYQRINRAGEAFSLHRFGALGADAAALSCFFEQPWTRLGGNLGEFQQAWLLNEVGFCLRGLGRLIEAVDPLRSGLKLSIRMNDWDNAGRSASNLSELELTLGEIAAAVRDAEQSILFSDRDRKVHCIGTRSGLAAALHQSGQLAHSLEMFEAAEALLASIRSPYSMLYSVDGFEYCDLLLSEPERAAWQCLYASGNKSHTMLESLLMKCRDVEDRATRTLEWNKTQGTPLDLGLNYLTLGRGALLRAIIDKDRSRTSDSAWSTIGRYITTSLADLQRAGDLTRVPPALLTRAWLCSLSGADGEARADLDAAWDIAEHGPMRLHMADIHLYRARLFHDKQELHNARSSIEHCGYGRRRGELEDAELASGIL